MKISKIAALALALIALPGLTGLGEESDIVKKRFEDFKSLPAFESAYVVAHARLDSSDEHPNEGFFKKSMFIEVKYSGKGFEHSGISFSDGKIPGNCKKIRFYAKVSSPKFSWIVKFKDAKGREELNGKKFEYGIKASQDKWTLNEFAPPPDWERPLTLAVIAAHNWSDKTTAADASLLVNSLEIETEIPKGTDPSSLMGISCGASQNDRIFCEGEKIGFNIDISSWTGKEMNCKLDYEISGSDGKSLEKESKNFKFSDSFHFEISPKIEKFGSYELSLKLSCEGCKDFEKKMRFVYIPKAQEYTMEEKYVSPYGLNSHGGKTDVNYPSFHKIGFVWLRDYAYSYGWMLRAKGDDGKYNGWPWYQKMDRTVKSSGMLLLPCLMGMLSDGIKKGDMSMSQEMKTNLAHIFMSFPDYLAWEADNEFDYKLGKEEAARNWSAYGAYHKKFADTVKFINEKALAVEQGNAGFFPERTAMLITKGDFENIDVINGHFYCGTNPPELNKYNYNANQGIPIPPRSLFDGLRAYKEAASCDGKKRQTWITEFGWDTLAGHIVSEDEQAAYLQRGFMLGIEAGIDKMFWFSDTDTKDKPINFFDGCGVLDPKLDPKPVCASMAAIAKMMKLPKSVGNFTLGENTYGRVFSDRGKLLAAVFKLDPAKPDIKLEIPEGELFDIYSNPIKGRKISLGVSPVWITPISPEGDIYKQTAFDLKSNYYNGMAAGDEGEILFRASNNRKTPISAKFSVRIPDGWTAVPSSGTIDAAVGETKVVPIRIKSPSSEKSPLKKVLIDVVDGDAKKTIEAEYAMILPGSVSSVPLIGNPGKSPTKATVTNNGSDTKTFALSAVVPKSWKISPEKIDSIELPANSSKSFDFEVEWSPNWRPDEKALFILSAPNGTQISECGIIPPAMPIYSAGKIAFDGKLDDWPAECKIPSWALGSTASDSVADIYMGYSKDGISIALDVKSSKLAQSDPRSFWSQDSAEIFIDTLNDKNARREYAVTDHQFWVSPQTNEKRAYLGRWKRNNETPAIEYDIKGIESFSMKKGDGYILEVRIPAEKIKDFKPEKGAKLGMDLILNIKRNPEDVQIYWPREKADQIAEKPQLWGTLEFK